MAVEALFHRVGGDRLRGMAGGEALPAVEVIARSKWFDDIEQLLGNDLWQVIAESIQ